MMRGAAASRVLDRPLRLTSLVLATFLLIGCAMDNNLQRVNESVSPVAVGDPGEVGAMALARSMIRAGFTRNEILELGPGIRSSLARTGGAQARRKGEVVALFSHKDAKLYVTSGTSGTFVVDLNVDI